MNLNNFEEASLIAGAKICVQPSFSEAFGMVVIEAGACGVPVSVSAVGGIWSWYMPERRVTFFLLAT